MKKLKNILKRIKEFTILLLIVGGLVIVSMTFGGILFSKEKIITKYVEKEKEPAENIVKRIADEENVSWLMIFRIIECESKWDKYFKEKMKDGSYDRGLFAFNTKHYSQISDEDAFNPETATRLFIKEIKNGNLKNWICAKTLGYVK